MYGFHAQDGTSWRTDNNWTELTSEERKALLAMIKQHTTGGEAHSPGRGGARQGDHGL